MHLLRNTRIRTTLCIFACVLIAFGTAPRAHAQLFDIAKLLPGIFGGGADFTVEVVGDDINELNTVKAIASEIWNARTTGGIEALQLKEYVLDGLAHATKMQAFNGLLADMIDIVSGGFDGQVGFVTNRAEHYRELGDRTAGEFIYGPELETLCEPIRFQVRSAILKEFKEEGRGTYTPECTIEEVEGVDMEAFIAGDFSKGGLDAFFELMVGSTNDPIKAYFDASTELYGRLAGEAATEESRLEASGEFLPQQSCEAIQNSTGFPLQRCTDVTPGSVLQQVFSYFMGEGPAQQILSNDEFNEVFSSLTSSIPTLSLRGTFGILGLGNNPQYQNNQFGDGSQSFTTALRNEDAGGSTSLLASRLTEAQRAEEHFLNLQEQILADIEALENDLEAGKSTYPGCFDLTLDEDLAGGNLAVEKENAEAFAAASNFLIPEYQNLRDLLANATTGATRKAVSDGFVELQNTKICEGTIGSSQPLGCTPVKTTPAVDNFQREFVGYVFETMVNDFADLIFAEEDRCN